MCAIHAGALMLATVNADAITMLLAAHKFICKKPVVCVWGFDAVWWIKQNKNKRRNIHTLIIEKLIYITNKATYNNGVNTEQAPLFRDLNLTEGSYFLLDHGSDHYWHEYIYHIYTHILLCKYSMALNLLSMTYIYLSTHGIPWVNRP